MLFELFLNKFPFQINNLGPWRAPYVEVEIDWPHQVGNDKPQGKWLLYLESMPTVEGTGGGECTVAGRQVNPLGLKAREPEAANFMAASLREDPTLMKRNNKSHSFALEYSDKSSPSFSPDEKKSANDDSFLNRVKRDRSMVIRADKLTDTDGKKTNIVSMVRNFSLIQVLRNLSCLSLISRSASEKLPNALELIAKFTTWSERPKLSST